MQLLASICGYQFRFLAFLFPMQLLACSIRRKQEVAHVLELPCSCGRPGWSSYPQASSAHLFSSLQAFAELQSGAGARPPCFHGTFWVFQQKPLSPCCHLFTCKVVVLKCKHVKILDLISLLIVGVSGGRMLHGSGFKLSVFPNAIYRTHAVTRICVVSQWQRWSGCRGSTMENSSAPNCIHLLRDCFYGE